MKEGMPTFGSAEKAPERLQAQIEAFADKSVQNFSDDQAFLFRYSAELSKIKDLNNLPADLPQELVQLILKHKDAYVKFLRQEKKLETDFIEENIKNYKKKFQSVILELNNKIALGNFKELPEYLGSGSNGSAFRIEVDGKVYAAKYSRNLTQANFEIKPLIRAKGIPHTSQLVAYSLEDNVVIMNLLSGTDVTNIPPDKVLEYTDEDIIQLIDTVIELDVKGLVIDPKPSNFMYDEKQGFSVLDYHIKHGYGYELPQQIIDLKLALTARKFARLDYKAADYKEQAEAQAIEHYKIFLPTIIRFLGILKNKYPDIIAEWKNKHEEDKANPMVSVSDLIERSRIPKIPEFEPYIKKLEEMGF